MGDQHKGHIKYYNFNYFEFSEHRTSNKVTVFYNNHIVLFIKQTYYILCA